MLRILITAMLAIASSVTAAAEINRCPSDHDVPPAVAASLDEVLAAVVTPESTLAEFVGYAPGGVLSVRAPTWQFSRAVGVVGKDSTTPVTCDMPFQIGSNTKMMTATVLLQLAEEGKLSLDDQLYAHLPKLAARLPNGREITLRQLANHTSGVFSYTDNAPDGTPGIMEGDVSDSQALKRSYQMVELVEFAIEHGQPSFVPGADGRWSYSNTGYVLLGLVIEEIEGRPIADSMKYRIFDRLGLQRTVYWSDVPTPELGLPRSYLSAPFDVETTDWNLSQGAAAGAVISTASDMHKFIRALVAGKLFRRPETLDLMKEVVATGNFLIPRYGIGIVEKMDGAWGHGGQTLGFESDVVYFSDPDISVVGWGTSSSNSMGLGAAPVASALHAAQVIPEP